MLPVVAVPLQRGLTRTLAGNAQIHTRLAGALLVAIAVIGLWAELLPNLTS